MSYTKPQLEYFRNTTVTVPLLTVLQLALGPEMKGTAEWPDVESAEILELIFKGKTLFKFQFQSWEGEPLDHPILWSWEDWHYSSTNYKRLKLIQEQNIELRAIERANVKIISRAVKEVFMQDDDDIATATAYRLLKKKQFGTIKNVLGVDKLIAKVEEIR